MLAVLTGNGNIAKARWNQNKTTKEFPAPQSKAPTLLLTPFSTHLSFRWTLPLRGGFAGSFKFLNCCVVFLIKPPSAQRRTSFSGSRATGRSRLQFYTQLVIYINSVVLVMRHDKGISYVYNLCFCFVFDFSILFPLFDLYSTLLIG